MIAVAQLGTCELPPKLKTNFILFDVPDPQNILFFFLIPITFCITISTTFTLYFTKLKLLLKQYTSMVVAQLEGCELPPSELTADFILSVVANPHKVMFI
jgi:hypothetical protein